MGVVKSPVKTEDNKLEHMRKEIVKKYLDLGLVDDKRSNNNYILVSKEEYDDWD